MAAIDHFPTPPNGLRVFGYLRGAAATLRRWRMRRAARRALARMSDWELTDLGLRRVDFERLGR